MMLPSYNNETKGFPRAIVYVGVQEIVAANTNNQ